MSDDSKEFQVRVTTTGDASGAKQVNESLKETAAATQAATERTKELTAATEAAASAEEKFAASTAKWRAEQGLGQGTSGLASGGVDAEQSAEEKEALAREQERAELEERRNSIISQRVAIEETETELLAAQAAGENEKIAALSAELEVRRETLRLQATGILSEEEAAAIATERWKNREAIALQERAQELLNKQLVADEAELLAAEKAMNAELAKEQALREANLKTIEASAAAEAGEGAGIARGASYAGRRAVGGALGIGMRGLAGGLPQIAAFIAISEAIKGVVGLYDQWKEKQEAIRQEHEKFAAGLQQMVNMKADLASIEQSVLNSRTAMQEFAEETERSSRVIGDFEKAMHQAYGALRSKNQAETEAKVADINTDRGLSDEEKAQQIHRAKMGQSAEQQGEDQKRIADEMSVAEARRQSAAQGRAKEEENLAGLKDQIQESQRLMEEKAARAQIEDQKGNENGAKRFAKEASDAKEQMLGLVGKYQDQVQTLEKAKQEEQKVVEQTDARLALLKAEAKSSEEVYNLEKRKMEAEENVRQQHADKQHRGGMAGQREKEIQAALGYLPQSADDAAAAQRDIYRKRQPGEKPRTPDEEARNKLFLDRERLQEERAGIQYQQAGEEKDPELRARRQQLIKEEEMRRRFDQMPPELKAAQEANQVAGAHAGQGSNTAETSSAAVAHAKSIMQKGGSANELSQLVATLNELIAHAKGLSDEEKRMLREADANAKKALSQIQNGRH